MAAESDKLPIDRGATKLPEDVGVDADIPPNEVAAEPNEPPADWDANKLPEDVDVDANIPPDAVAAEHNELGCKQTS